MSFKFITNSISTSSKVPTLSDIVKAAQTKAAMEKAAKSANSDVVKTASTAPVKEAGEKGKSNPKNLTAPKFGPGGKATKEEGTEVDAKAKKAGAPANVKVAEEKEEGESSKQLDVEPLHQKSDKGENADKKKAPSSGKTKSDGEGESSGQLDVEPLHQKGESTQEKPADLDTMKTESKKEAKSGNKTKVANFKKIAELTPKQKEFLRKVWSMYWPKSFIDSILAD
jgi:hypothetical protein